MKKLLMLSTVALVFGAMPALADHHEGSAGGEEKAQRKYEEMFARKDANSDGIISKEEFMAAYEKKFVELDVDGNGEISRAESEAKHKEWREKMKEKRAARQEKMEEKASEE